MRVRLIGSDKQEASSYRGLIWWAAWTCDLY